MAIVSVQNNILTNPLANKSSVISLKTGINPAWWTPTPFLNNLTVEDDINIDGGDVIAALTGGSQVIGDINTAGEWGFDAITNVLSYYNDSQGQVDSITLTGVTSVELQAGGNLFTIAGGLV